ncbi:MAG: DUF885 family protein [Acidobacteriota bacterium]
MRRLLQWTAAGACLTGTWALVSGGGGDAPALRRPEPAAYTVDVHSLPVSEQDSLRGLVERYREDLGSLRRYFEVPFSAARYRKLREFYEAWRKGLQDVPFDTLGPEARIDYLALANRIAQEEWRLDKSWERQQEAFAWVPRVEELARLFEARQRVLPMDPAAAATLLDDAAQRWRELRAKVGAANSLEAVGLTRLAAARTARLLRQVERGLEDWYRFYGGYDPLMTWWCRRPYEEALKEVRAYRKALRMVLGDRFGEGDRVEHEAIVGDPVGRVGIERELGFEMIPYTPQELIRIAEMELEWCRKEMVRASEELGFGGDWKAALEYVKGKTVPPGRQPELVVGLAVEAVNFLESRGLLTIPPLAKDSWRVEMMTPERQKVNPFFTGGEVISVSYPHESMDHRDKLMSMRGNNIHFSRATVFHELIPGHYLQQFMNARYRSYREVFWTPFWIEGWALYWELRLWDLGFQQSPEDRIGALFWRMHRCARIIFSLNFHLGNWSPEECIDFLVEEVGHERANAEAEVRRSVEVAESPLYQCAYLLGGLQFRALHRELVESGRMSEREFHDAVLQMNTIPVELVRAGLTGVALPRDFRSSWRFYGEVGGAVR